MLLHASPSGVEEALRQCMNGNKNVLQTVQELVVMQHSIIYTLLCMAITISMCYFYMQGDHFNTVYADWGFYLIQLFLRVRLCWKHLQTTSRPKYLTVSGLYGQM